MVALQALAYYAAFSGANAIDLRLDVSAPAPMFVSQFSINSTNYRISQIQEVINPCGIPQLMPNMCICDILYNAGFSTFTLCS